MKIPVWFVGICLAVCLLASGTVAAPVSIQDTAGFQKILVLNMECTGDSCQVLSSEVRYGQAPNLEISSGPLKGEIIGTSGSVLRTFSLQDPSLSYSDPLVMGTHAAALQNENTVRELIVTVPVTPSEKTFRLSDKRTGGQLILADISSPLVQFCSVYSSDPDCLSLEGSTVRPASSWMVLFTLIIAGIVVTSGIATFLILRSPKPRASAPVPARPSVFVVDDDSAIGDYLTLFLTHSGYGVSVANSGQACLEALKQQVPDVILLDVMMEPLDGWMTLEQIRADPKTKSVPVLMITAKPLEPEDVLRYHVSIDDYIVKPFANNEISAAISQILARKKKVVDELRLVQNAGVSRETYCELQRLAKRMDVDRKLLLHLRRQYALVSDRLPQESEFWVTVRQLISSSLSSEVRIEELRRRIAEECARNGCPVPDW